MFATVWIGGCIFPTVAWILPLIIEIGNPFSAEGTLCVPRIIGISARFCCCQIVLAVISAICIKVWVSLLDVLRFVRRIKRVPRPVLTFGVEKNYISYAPVYFAPLFSVVMSTRTFLRNLTTIVRRTEDRIEQNLQIMARGRVAVKIKRTCRFEDAVKFF